MTLHIFGYIYQHEELSLKDCKWERGWTPSYDFPLQKDQTPVFLFPQTKTKTNKQN